MSDISQKSGKHQASVRAYIVGFILSILLTVGAYLLVSQHVNGDHSFLSHTVIVGIVLVLAVVQLIVQLLFFLHLGQEDKPRWNLRVLLFAVLVVVILIIGSIWIMKNLDYSHGLPAQESAIIEDEGFKVPHDESMTDHNH